MWEFLVPIVSGLLQSDAAGDAADSQAAGNAAAINEQRRQFDLTREDFAPWRETGQRTLRQLESELRRQPTAAEVMAQPGYQFGLSEGQRAIDRKIAASGGRVSGNAIKAAARYGTDYATTGYNQEWARRQDRLQRLQALAGLGQSATSSTASAGTNTANALSSLYQNQGANQGAAQLAQGNIWGNAVNEIGANYLHNRRRQAPYAGYGSAPYNDYDFFGPQ